LYGTTFFGGTGACSPPSGYTGCGTVFSLTPSGSQYIEKTLYSFQGGQDGQAPGAKLVADDSGNLYGTTEWGGNTNAACRKSPEGNTTCGTIFEVTPSGGEQIVYRFKGGQHDGSGPRGALRQLASGSFIGTTLDGGGRNGGQGGGSVYEIAPSGGRHTERIIYFFGRHPGDGIRPQNPDGLAIDSSGNLYGATVSSDQSPCGCGSVFELTPTASGYSEKVLHFFNGVDGAFPHSSVIVDRGMLYGTTFDGGNYCYGSSYSCGLVYKIR
jgi:hypothetical protein